MREIYEIGQFFPQLPYCFAAILMWHLIAFEWMMVAQFFFFAWKRALISPLWSFQTLVELLRNICKRYSTMCSSSYAFYTMSSCYLVCMYTRVLTEKDYTQLVFSDLYVLTYVFRKCINVNLFEHVKPRILEKFVIKITV